MQSHLICNNMLPLKIQEIIVIGNKGEFKLSSNIEKNSTMNNSIAIMPTIASVGPHTLDRIKLYIHNLAALAEITHKKALPVHSSSCELITRLIMSEFSLYTKDTPLSFNEYKELIEYCHDITKKLSPNIHLILGTVAVFWPSKKVRNCALYVVSPINHLANPKIYHFSKSYVSDIDLLYGHKLNKEGGYKIGEPDIDEENYMKQIPYLTNSPSQYRSAIKIETSKGNSFITCGEICLDHYHGLALQNFENLICKLLGNDLTIPLYLSQFLTSNSIFPERVNLAVTLTHADSDLAIAKVGDTKPLQKLIYSTPPFGKNVQIKIYPPKYVGIVYGRTMDYIAGKTNSLSVSNVIHTKDSFGKTIFDYVIEDSENDNVIPRILSILKHSVSLVLTKEYADKIKAIINHHQTKLHKTVGIPDRLTQRQIDELKIMLENYLSPKNNTVRFPVSSYYLLFGKPPSTESVQAPLLKLGLN